MTHDEKRERRRVIAERCQKGELPRKLAVEFGVTTETVRRARHEYGISIYHPRSDKGKTILSILVKLFDESKSMDVIAAEMGVTTQRVSDVYQEAAAAGVPGLPVRTQGRWKGDRGTT